MTKIDLQLFEELALQKVSAKEMSKQLNCSESYVQYLKKKYNLKVRDFPKEVKCSTCGETDITKFYNHKQKTRCKKCTIESMKQRTQEFKLKLFKLYDDNKCQICGYNKCYQALEFHHINPKEKEFNIAQMLRQSSILNENIIKEELKKCILVCSNCHREIHAGCTETNPCGSPYEKFSSNK